MGFSLRGVHLPHRKNTANMPAVSLATPKTVVLPTVMHIGKPAKPVVKVGDHVDVGTLVAEQDGFISSPVHASISGTVTKIADTLLSNGTMVPAITIEGDGEMTPDPAIVPPVVTDRASFIEAVRQSGIVGLGGAGFPTYVKLATDKPIEMLIINGAECEPYITSDTRTMIDRVEDMERGLIALEEHLGITNVIIAVENNKKEAIASMKKLAADDAYVNVKVLPSLYPQGGEKVLIYHTTGKKVGVGMLPIDVGCIVLNCSTVAAIGNYLKTGMPLVERTITIDGGAVVAPQNVIAPIGMTLEEVFAACGGFKEDPVKVLYGGPMMGIAVPDLGVPVLKNTNALLALTAKENEPIHETPCIRCGACTRHCPFGLRSQAIARANKLEDLDMLKKLQVETCMECGCCAFVCPANRPLIQSNRIAKAKLREAAAKQKAKEGSK